MNAVNEHHIIQSVKEVSEQQAENTSNVSATVVKKNYTAYLLHMVLFGKR